jgi:hypothetical protein
MGDSELPLHLLLPFAASALFVVGLMLIKKAGTCQFVNGFTMQDGQLQ